MFWTASSHLESLNQQHQSRTFIEPVHPFNGDGTKLHTDRGIPAVKSWEHFEEALHMLGFSKYEYDSQDLRWIFDHVLATETGGILDDASHFSAVLQAASGGIPSDPESWVRRLQAGLGK